MTMSHWNHRLVDMGEGCLRICEVCYHKDGRLELIDDNPAIQGQSKAEVKLELKRMRKALEKPVLKWNAETKEVGRW